MSSCTFDQDHCPELLDVPLKGKYMQEFATLIKEQRQVAIDTLKQLPPENVKDARGIIALLGQLSDHFQEPKAQQFGITLSELETVLNLYMADPSLNVQETLAAVHQASERDSEKEYYHDMADLAENAVSLTIRALFSQALAVQERRESDYNRLTDEYHDMMKPALLDELSGAKDLPEHQKLGIATYLIETGTIFDNVERAQKSRRSMVSGLTSHLNRRKEELHEYAFSLIYDLDLDTHAGKQAVQSRIQEVKENLNSIETQRGR